ncbi:MAG TPA: ATP-binding cassette domain-containing protein [Anaerolineales bacterium]|nr:ATP-binding cassette domain-containing protein [Anaerolineales bacterium]
MEPVEVDQIAKSFGSTQAVTDVSFVVRKGEIFGLLGPNGAGKTTAIRMLLDIFKPDRGSISILGGPISDASKDRIGYMPEERGLYQEISLERCLFYLARLKGLSRSEVQVRLDRLLDRFDLAAHRKKKVKELSKGMQQKAQIISTILHEPDLIIVDEPFTALDPLNVQLVKDVMLELREAGTTLIMSTHQMHQVEELCDRILLIDHGRDLLYGDLDEIRQRFSGHAVLVRTGEEIPALPGVVQTTVQNRSIKLTLAEDTSPQDVLRSLTSRNIPLEKFEIAVPSLDEIFIQVVKAGEAE